MNVLMLDSDGVKLTEEPNEKNEYTRYRHIQYAQRVDSLHILGKTLRRKNLEIRHHSNKLICYPTHSFNLLTGLVDLYRQGTKIIKEQHIDVIVTSDPFGAGLVGLLLKNKFQISLSVQLFGDHVFNDHWKRESLKHKAMSWVAKYCFKSADSLRLMSEMIKEKVVREFGVDVKKIFILPIFVRKENFISFNSNNNNSLREEFIKSGFSHFVLFAGRFMPQKDLKTLLKAIPIVVRAYPKALFCLVGDGPLRTEIENEARSSGVINNMCFEGEVPQKEMAKYYNACDIFALSSSYEDTARVLIEAAFSAKPIITTDTTGARDIVVNENSGFVVKVGDYLSFAKSIITLLDNPDMARRFGEFGRKWMLDKFDDQKIIDGVIAMWKFAFNNKRIS